MDSPEAHANPRANDVIRVPSIFLFFFFLVTVSEADRSPREESRLREESARSRAQAVRDEQYGLRGAGALSTHASVKRWAKWRMGRESVKTKD